MSPKRNAGVTISTATKQASAPAWTSAWRRGDVWPDASSTAPIATLSSAVRTRLAWVPRSGIATKPLSHAPAIAPSVLQAYAVPTLRPTTCGPRATTLLTSGKVAPMQRVGGTITMNVLTNVSHSGAPQLALLNPSHHASRP